MIRTNIVHVFHGNVDFHHFELTQLTSVHQLIFYVHAFRNSAKGEVQTYDQMEADQVRLWAIGERWTQLDIGSEARKS